MHNVSLAGGHKGYWQTNGHWGASFTFLAIVVVLAVITVYFTGFYTGNKKKGTAKYYIQPRAVRRGLKPAYVNSGSGRKVARGRSKGRV